MHRLLSSFPFRHLATDKHSSSTNKHPTLASSPTRTCQVPTQRYHRQKKGTTNKGKKARSHPPRYSLLAIRFNLRRKGRKRNVRIAQFHLFRRLTLYYSSWLLYTASRNQDSQQRQYSASPAFSDNSARPFSPHNSVLTAATAQYNTARLIAQPVTFRVGKYTTTSCCTLCCASRQFIYAVLVDAPSRATLRSATFLNKHFIKVSFIRFRGTTPSHLQVTRLRYYNPCLVAYCTLSLHNFTCWPDWSSVDNTS